MTIHVSNTKSGVLIYVSAAAAWTLKITSKSSVDIDNSGRIHIAKSKQGFTDPSQFPSVRLFHKTPEGMDQFGKTEFSSIDDKDTVVINTNNPKAGYRKVKTKSTVDIVSLDQITEAVRLINSLDRNQYRLFINTEDNSLKVIQEIKKDVCVKPLKPPMLCCCKSAHFRPEN